MASSSLCASAFKGASLIAPNQARVSKSVPAAIQPRPITCSAQQSRRDVLKFAAVFIASGALTAQQALAAGSDSLTASLLAKSETNKVRNGLDAVSIGSWCRINSFFSCELLAKSQSVLNCILPTCSCWRDIKVRGLTRRPASGRMSTLKSIAKEVRKLRTH